MKKRWIGMMLTAATLAASVQAELIANFDFQNYAEDSLGNDPAAATTNDVDRLYSNNTAVVTGVLSVSDIAFTVATINQNQNMIDADGAPGNMAYRPDFDGPLSNSITATFVVTLDDGFSLSDYSVGFKENNNNAGTNTYSITANGAEIGSGTLTGTNEVYDTGSVAGPLTGAVTFVVALTPGDDSTATMRADDFTLNGEVLSSEPSPPEFTSDPINKPDAYADIAYNSSIADDAFDLNGDPMTFSLAEAYTWLTVDPDGAIHGTPGAGHVGTNEFTVQVDAVDGSDTATLVIEVLAVNEAPSFTVDPINKADAVDGSAYSGSIAGDASDPEGDPMTFSLVDTGTWLSVSTNGLLSGTPGVEDIGPNVFTVQVDAIGGSDTATLNINVLDSALVANVYIVSDLGKTGATLERDSLITFLQANFGEQLGTITTDLYADAPPAAVAGDLVIIARTTTSSDYAGSPEEIASWNGLEAGILCLSPYVTESDRWGWRDSPSSASGGTATNESEVIDHPLLDGVTVVNGKADLLNDITGASPSMAIMEAGNSWAGGTTVARQKPAARYLDTLVQIGDSRIAYFFCDPGEAGYAGITTDLSADGLIVLENAIRQLLMGSVVEPKPAVIEGIEVLSNGVVRLEIGGAEPAATYFPENTTHLMAGWGAVPHSDDGVNPFIVSDLTYCTTDGTNKFIYIQGGNDTDFFRIQSFD